jgi:phosphonopyruvate decarboxylase
MICGIPDKVLAKWVKGKEYIKPADEGEAIAIGAGHYIATGKRATVFMSVDGFLNALCPVTSLVIPEEIKMNIVIGTGRQEPQHKVATDMLKGLIKLLPYDPKRIHFKIIEKK